MLGLTFQGIQGSLESSSREDFVLVFQFVFKQFQFPISLHTGKQVPDQDFFKTATGPQKPRATELKKRRTK